jgi:RHH-type proline utilization regulon transcriptional repressor/proline dehydrogenase/delta 1-pyrroline-5-carboxylate dehydrogenase
MSDGQEHAFKNEPLKDFSIEENRRGIVVALERIESTIRSGGFTATPIIGGRAITTAEVSTRTDPSDTRVVIGKTHFAQPEDAALAVNSCVAGLTAWRRRPYTERASIIRTIGLLMRERANVLTALIIREAGKTWREADADVAEAIDFCLYYAEEMLRLGKPHLTERVLGEENHYYYQPRGVVAIIAPWNFPLAIACGMTVAALVCGNTAILKPSEQTSLIAHEFAKIAYEAGLPKDAFAYLPGRGEEVGRALVESPHVSMIVFTGSRPVGLEIIRSAANVSPGQIGIKKVVAELGGKNAIIVDEDADFDDAIRGVLQSAFGFAGQKCSALSRLIIVGDAYEPFLARLAAATSDLVVGPASDPASFYGPVVDQESHTRITKLIASASDLMTLVQGTVPEQLREVGWYIPPTIFRDVPLSHPVFRDEIFGPVVAAVKARTFDEALTIANDCEYALTGGVFSRNPEHLNLAKSEFQVGNLYINRGITGALVCRQPFGGFKFSGVGSKAGGKDYLLQFMEPRTLTENTMRRGFTPDLNS